MFSGDLHTRWIGPDAKGEGDEMLTRELIWSGDRVITIPAGFISDGGSIPWWGRWLIDPMHCRRAWVLHDWAWTLERRDHAELLDAALKADNCRPLLRRLIVAAVRIRAAMIRRA